MAEYVCELGGQAVQAINESEPVWVLYVSAGHGWHGFVLCVSLKYPAKHCVQGPTQAGLDIFTSSKTHSCPFWHKRHCCSVIESIPRQSVLLLLGS